MSVTSVVESISALNRPLAMRDLKGLSGLGQGDRPEFWPAWQRIAAARRAEIARDMVDLAEDNVELDFDQVLAWLLDDPDAAVRISAVEGLWEDTSPGMMRRMLAMLRDDRSPEVRAVVATALSRFAYLAVLDELDNPDALEQGLAAVALNEREPVEVRRRALESAGYFAESDEIQQQIGRDYRSGEQLLCESALVAMGRSMLPSWLPIINDELGSPSPALRYEAARAAGEMAEEAQRVLPKLAPLINDDDTEVALAAIWALGQIGGDAARRALQRVSKSQDETRSQAATEALNELTLGDAIV